MKTLPKPEWRGRRLTPAEADLKAMLEHFRRNTLVYDIEMPTTAELNATTGVALR